MIADLLTKPLQGYLFRRLRGEQLNLGTVGDYSRFAGVYCDRYRLPYRTV